MRQMGRPMLSSSDFRLAILLITTLVNCKVSSQTPAPVPPSCDREIFCQGKLLHEVQLQKIFDDSKTFVDLKLKTNEAVILKKFEKLKANYPDSFVPKNKLAAFVKRYFIACEDDPTCRELLPWEPKDWQENPPFVDKIKDPVYKRWAYDLNGIWKRLGRIMDVQVQQQSNQTSLIYLPNGFIIPGGRFQELYYWDTFWVLKGILISGMFDTARGIIINFLTLVKNLDHIPNGSRVYYIHRTQPPLLIHMVEAYVQATGDESIIKESIQLLGQEMEYFISNRRVTVKKGGKTYEMFRYYAVSSGPRPESYREDYEHAQKKKSDDERTQFYIAMKSGAESGWDFSSRWFINKCSNQGNLLDIQTPNIIPVDLNSILHKNFKLLANWYKSVGSESRAQYFSTWADNLLTAINEVLWNEEDKVWYDYDILDNKPREYYYLSNLAPLWTESYSMGSENLTSHMLSYISKLNLRQYIGGLPSSLMFTSEQWDYPDAWPPLQYFIIEGLRKLDTITAKDLASHFAATWLKSNLAGYHKYGKMFEKYDSLHIGEPGSGGEYAEQDGFGWTNGIAMELMSQYGDVLSWDQSTELRSRELLTNNIAPDDSTEGDN